MQVFREIRLGLTTLGGVVTVTDETRVPLLFTGQADVIAISDDGKRAMVIDTKTGRGDYKHAAENEQLRSLAILVAKRFRCSTVRVAIVQPWAGRPTVADFDQAAINAGFIWLFDVLGKADRATPADLKAGDWCQWCKARAACPELRAKALVPVHSPLTLRLPEDDKTARAALFARAMELDAETLASYMRDLRLMGWVASAIEGAAKTRAKDDPAFQQFYRLKPGVVREKIVDVGAVFQRVAALGVSADEFTAACSLTKTELESMVRKATLTKGAALKSRMAEVLAGATEAKETSTQLEEVKP